MNEDIERTAALWHAAQADDDMDWDGFTSWLEADPRHRAAFDELAILEARIENSRDLLRSLTAPVETPNRPKRFNVHMWGALAAAALAVAAVAVVVSQPGVDVGPTYLEHRAPPGRTQPVQLADGSSMTLDPGSIARVSTKRSEPIFLRGRAVFDVRHDAARPMIIRAGPYEVRDVGTVFEISSTDAAVRVAVTEGAVSVRSIAGQRVVKLSAGQSVTALGGGQEWHRGIADPRAAAPWSPGPLAYDGVPLALVAGDISRLTGQAVIVDEDAARRRFTGVIAPGNRDTMAQTLSQLTGVPLRRDADAMRLGSRPSR